MQCLTILVEQAVVLCQVEKAKEDMLNQLYTSIRLVLSNYFRVLGISLSICYFQGKNVLLFFPCVIYLWFEHHVIDFIFLMVQRWFSGTYCYVFHENENFYLLRSWFRFCCFSFSLLGANMTIQCRIFWIFSDTWLLDDNTDIVVNYSH